MAKPYLELFGFRSDPSITRRIRVAAELKAADILLDSNATAGAKSKAVAVLRNEVTETQIAQLALRCLADISIREVGLDCTDAQIQSVVDASFLGVF
jgi:hypothetical protein